MTTELFFKGTLIKLIEKLKKKKMFYCASDSNFILTYFIVCTQYHLFSVCLSRTHL